ncbi:MAG TPA: DUF1343 domain-containing protein [Bryobacteraceae bacterium]|nr:DUF1343 domain-containing protein [Bryobacteraceae bacterium]
MPLLLAASAAFAGDVRTGLDVLAAHGFRQLEGKRVGLITNQSGFERSGRRTIDLLARAGNLKLVAIFSPEHGIFGTSWGREGRAESTDAATGVPIFNLWGKTQRPTPEMLRGIDTLVYDIQDVGARFYTYMATLGVAMEEAAVHNIEVVVLDRPNPISGAVVEGPVQDQDLLGFVCYFPMPSRYGMTIGEQAMMFNAEKKMGLKLTVVKMENWRRRDWFDQTGLRRVNPSPNLWSLYPVVLYPALNMLNMNGMSIGRATENPYNILGAPWIDGERLAAYLNARSIAGVSFIPLRFTPSADRFGGQECGGVFVNLLDRDRLNTGRLGIELVAALWKLYPQRFELQRTLHRVGSKKVLEAIRRGDDPEAVERSWQQDLERFRQIRAKYLIYE